jgi:hypothetical protein
MHIWINAKTVRKTLKKKEVRPDQAGSWKLGANFDFHSKYTGRLSGLGAIMNAEMSDGRLFLLSRWNSW